MPYFKNPNNGKVSEFSTAPAEVTDTTYWINGRQVDPHLLTPEISARFTVEVRHGKLTPWPEVSEEDYDKYREGDEKYLEDLLAGITI